MGIISTKKKEKDVGELEGRGIKERKERGGRRSRGLAKKIVEKSKRMDMLNFSYH